MEMHIILTRYARQRRAAALACLFVLSFLTACKDGSSSPTAPNPPPQGIANATAFSNLSLARTLQDLEVPGTLLVGVSAAGVQRDGRIEPGNTWSYSFADIAAPGALLYTWRFDIDGRVTMSGPNPPVAPFSGIDIEPSLSVNSDQAIALAESFGGAEYFRQHPNATISLGYFHFASQVRVQLRYFDLSPDMNGCEITIVLDASSGGLISRDVGCLGL